MQRQMLLERARVPWLKSVPSPLRTQLLAAQCSLKNENRSLSLKFALDAVNVNELAREGDVTN